MRALVPVFVAAMPGHCAAPLQEPVWGDTGGLVEDDGVAPEQRSGGGALSDAGWDRTSAADVCAVWRQERQWRDEGRFDGDAETCLTGDNPVSRANALGQLNLMRWLAGQPDAVTTSPDLDGAAQQCALLLEASESLSHSPSPSAECYTSRAAEAAAASVLASAPAVAAVDLFFLDIGHEDSLGHRRWLLSNTLGRTGIGSTATHSCIWVVDDSGQSEQTWTAWPPPGPFPVDAFRPSSVRDASLSDTGWHVQSDTHNLSSAQVWMSRNGEAASIDVWPLAPGFGSRSAVGFAPRGWAPEAGDVLRVHVVGGGLNERYQIDVVDCG